MRTPALLALFALAASGCFSRSLDKSQAQTLIKSMVEQNQLTYTLFLGPMNCPRGCADCSCGELCDLAKQEGWITLECTDGNILLVEPTDVGKRVIARQPRTPRADGAAFYRIVIGHGELLQVNQPEQQGSGRASVSYTWDFRPSATALELLAGGPRELAKTTWRLCETDRKWLSRDDDCAMGHNQDSIEYYWDSQKGAWTSPSGGAGGGILGPR